MKYNYIIFNEMNRYKVPERKLFYKYTTKTFGLNGKIYVHFHDAVMVESSIVKEMDEDELELFLELQPKITRMFPYSKIESDKFEGEAKFDLFTNYYINQRGE